MAPFSTWTELPHGKLTALEDNLLTVVGELTTPGGEIARRMTVVRLRDGRLVLYSAVPLGDQEMAALARFGAPAFLVVPSAIHRKAAKVWKERFPALKVIAPDSARAKTEKVVPVDATQVDFQDASVRYVTVPGADGYEAALTVMSRGMSGEVMRAALLHDVGKRHARLGAIGRSIASILIILGLPMMQRMNQYRDHGRIGADELEAIDAPEVAVEFARAHHGERPQSIDQATWSALQDADAPPNARALVRRPISWLTR